jgi:hypothetical protein
MKVEGYDGVCSKALLVALEADLTECKLGM